MLETARPSAVGVLCARWRSSLRAAARNCARASAVFALERCQRFAAAVERRGASRSAVNVRRQLVLVDAVTARERAQLRESIVEPREAGRIRFDAIAVVLQRRLGLA